MSYSTTSCKCPKHNFERGVSTNMSVMGCNFCNFSKHPFKTQIEPTNKSGYFYFNPKIQQKVSSNYNIIDPSKCQSNCSQKTFLNSDPRLYNSPSATWLQLDKPPMDGNVKLSEIYTNTDLDEYGKAYKSYHDINAGQITYYNDKSIEDAYYEPVFSEPAKTVGFLYKDPMGNIKPQYTRISNYTYNTVSTKPSNVAGKFCSSFVKDTNFAREEIMALQQRKNNEQRYNPRWTNNTF